MHETAPHPAARPTRGFTLVELLVVLAITGLLVSLAVPAAGRALGAARRIACASNLRQVNLAFHLYTADHDAWFPWREDTAAGTLWYWGLEPAGGPAAEGLRPLDRRRARLAPYFDHVGGIEVCPSMPYGAPYFKRKFSEPSYGYALNAFMLAGIPVCDRSGVRTLADVARPSETVAWADAAQVNTWMPPASPARPMLEEWYYLDNYPPAKFHFRHRGRLNAGYADGSVRPLAPRALDPRCDGRTGYAEEVRGVTMLRTDR